MQDSSSTEHGYADRAFRQLSAWPALTVCRADDGPGTGLALCARQVVHLHGHDEAEVYLTRPVIRRMADALNECDHVTVHPNEEWVRVRLDSPSDVTFLISLVSVAIKANGPAGARTRRPVAPCPRSLRPALTP